MTEQVLLVLTILLPLAGAAGIVLIGDRPNLREAVTLITAFGLFGINIALISFVTDGGRPEVELVPFIPVDRQLEDAGRAIGNRLELRNAVKLQPLHDAETISQG